MLIQHNASWVEGCGQAVSYTRSGEPVAKRHTVCDEVMNDMMYTISAFCMIS
jgi:hypothetical protein